MIVCVCTATCERRLEAAVAAGADTPEKIERHCGAGGDCGACRPDIERLIERLTLGAPRCANHGASTLPPGVTT
jgi:bacterioferritin-associated ferredoxin